MALQVRIQVLSVMGSDNKATWSTFPQTETAPPATATLIVAHLPATGLLAEHFHATTPLDGPPSAPYPPVRDMIASTGASCESSSTCHALVSSSSSGKPTSSPTPQAHGRELPHLDDERHAGQARRPVLPTKRKAARQDMSPQPVEDEGQGDRRGTAATED